MQAIHFSTHPVAALLHKHRVGLAAFGAVALLGAFTGMSVFSMAFCGKVDGLLQNAGQAQRPEFQPMMVLLYGLLPPLVYGASMLVSSFSKWAMPAWCLAIFLLGSLWGVEFGIFRSLNQAGYVLVAHISILLPFVLMMPCWVLLGVQPFIRLKRPPEPFGFDDLAGDVLAAVVPTMLLAAGNTVFVTLGCALCRNLLF